MYTIKFHDQIENDLSNLNYTVQREVFKKLFKIEQSPEIGKALGNKNGLNLSGLKKVYVSKKQVRIVYEIKEEQVIVYVIAIGKRKDMEVYRHAHERKNS